MLPIVAVVLALAASASAAYGPTPASKCCPYGAGKGICTDTVKGSKYDADCCNDGTWKCQGVGVYVPVCDSVGGPGKSCAAPPPPPPPPPPAAKKCCNPRATPKTCPGGYGKARVPALCCADGKFRCGGCSDFGGESILCKCCAKDNKPTRCTAQNAYGNTRQGTPVCCNDGQWKCNIVGSTTKTCAGYFRKGTQCPPPPPPPAKCCDDTSKLICTGGYTSSPTCCKDGSWVCGSCSSLGGNGKVCAAPPPPPPPATCCNNDKKIACTGEYAAPMCCKDGSWTCGTCSSGDGEVCNPIVY